MLLVASCCFRLRVYSFQHTRLFAFELLVSLQVFFGEIDGELEVAAMDAAVGSDAASADAEQALPDRCIVELKVELRSVRIEHRSPDERFTSAR